MGAFSQFIKVVVSKNFPRGKAPDPLLSESFLPLQSSNPGYTTGLEHKLPVPAHSVRYGRQWRGGRGARGAMKIRGRQNCLLFNIFG